MLSEYGISVTFHTPFGTGHLDEKRVTDVDDHGWGEAARYLTSSTSPAVWERVEDFPLMLQRYEQDLREELESEMPRPVLKVSPRNVDPRWHSAENDGVEWRLIESDLTFWNVGAALLVATLEVRLPPGTRWEHVGDKVTAHLSMMNAADQPWVQEGLVAFAAYVLGQGYADDWASPPPAERFWSAPLWTYASLAVKAPDACTDAQLGSTAFKLVDHGIPRSENTDSTRTVMRIGLRSCSVTRGDDRSAVARLRHHIDTHTACWGAAVTLHEVVWNKLVELQFEEKKGMTELDAETLSLLRLADKVRFFLVSLGGIRPHLRLQDGELWDCLDSGWRFPEVRGALAERLSALRELHVEKAARLSDRRLRRLNFVILILTILGTVAAATSIVSFFQGDHDVPAWACDLPQPPRSCEAEPSPGET